MVEKDQEISFDAVPVPPCSSSGLRWNAHEDTSVRLYVMYWKLSCIQSRTATEHLVPVYISF
jgi:hypothetical protein